MWGLLIAFCARHLEHPSSSSSNSQQAFLHSSVPGTSFPKQKCLGGNVPRVRHWWHQDCQGRNPGGSPRNVSWGTYCTPYLGMTVTVHPQFHSSWGFYDFPKNFHDTFKWLARWFFNLASQIFEIYISNQSSYLGTHKNSFFDFRITYMRKFFSQIMKPSTIFIQCPNKVFEKSQFYMK